MQIDRIRKELTKAERACATWRKVVSVCERCQETPLGNFPGSAYRAYLTAGSTTDAAKVLNEAGQRRGTRKFSSNDISHTIDHVEIEDTELMEVARFLLRGR